MVRKKDQFWEYAQNLNGKFKCNFCNNVYSGGITRLKFHLAGLKGNDVEVCTQVDNEVQAKAYMAMEKGSKRSRTEEQSGIGATGPTNETSGRDSCGIFGGMFSHSNSTALGKGMHQTTMPQILKKMDKSEMDDRIIRFFIMCSSSSEETREIKNGMNYLFEKLVAAEDKDAFLAQVQSYSTKIEDLFNVMAIGMLRIAHSRVWWVIVVMFFMCFKNMLFAF